MGIRVEQGGGGAPASRVVARRALVLGVIGVASFVALGCSGDGSGAAAEEPFVAPSTYVSTVAGTDFAIAVSTAGGRAADGTAEAVAYVCDGAANARWFFGTEKAGVVSAAATDGSTFKGTVAAGAVSGTVALPVKGETAFTAPQAAGIAGMYLVEHTGAARVGYSTARAKLEATESGGRVSGTVTPVGGAALPIAGPAAAFGTGNVSTWIVQTDGSVKGRTTDETIPNTTGGGNCSIWAKIKARWFGVDCTYFMKT
jgi:hypothetical protein